ncbi:MAG: tetraacyldisaccharide 4'-kinase [Elusimicrobiota bacterium]|nr:tetraacyldisaccharide 4'-kinase [Elusimicrobiota bacterium]
MENLRDKLKDNSLGNLILSLLSLVYGFIISTRHQLYKSGFFKKMKLPVKVICFGNISTGGTGKTSTVILAATELKKTGFNVAIIMRGYKRKNKSRKVVVLHKDRNFSPDEAGDEALMLYDIMKDLNIPIIVSSDRYKAGQTAIKEFNTNIILMDDGYQHFRLKRDKNFLLINAATDFQNEQLLPMGNLRENKDGLKRADLIILTHCERESEEKLKETKASIYKINPKAEIIESMHIPQFFIDAATLKKIPLDSIKGEVVAVSGIGDPLSFEKSLKSLGLKIRQAWRFPDHHRFTETEFKTIERHRKDASLIITYKDFSRFPKNWRKLVGKSIYILFIEVVFLCNGYKVFLDQVIEKGEGV